jgi:hypothetical protein
VTIWCDNTVAVSILNSGRGTVPLLHTIARNIWLWEAASDCEISFAHVKGKLNNIADLLSRWTVTANSIPKLFILLNAVPLWVQPPVDVLHLKLKFYFPEFPPQLQCFAERVRMRIQQAYRQSIQRAQHTATVALAAFCIYYDVSFPLVNIHTLLSFIEFRINSNLAVPTVKNYVSSIKSHFKSNGINIEVFPLIC